MTWGWTLHFEVAFDVDPGTVAVDDDFTDLTSRVHTRISTSMGLGRDGVRGGSASADLNNRDRELDPTNEAASHNLVPMRHARVAVTVDATRYPLWQGYVETWSPVWPEWNQGLIQVEMVDALTWLSLKDLDVNLPEQRSRQRIVEMLNDAGWPLGLRDLVGGVDGGILLEPYVQDGANVRRVIDDTADAEDGELYVNQTGQVTFRHRHYRFDASSVLTVGSSGMPVASVSPVYDTSSLTNIGRTELADGTVFEATDDDSVTAYGPRVLSIRDLPLPWYEANELPKWVVDRFADPLLWVDQVTLEWRDPDVDIAALADLEVGDLVTFTHQPPGGGAEVSYDLHVERIRHGVGRATGSTVLDLSPYFGEGVWGRWVSDAASEGTAWVSGAATDGPKWAP